MKNRRSKDAHPKNQNNSRPYTKQEIIEVVIRIAIKLTVYQPCLHKQQNSVNCDCQGCGSYLISRIASACNNHNQSTGLSDCTSRFNE